MKRLVFAFLLLAVSVPTAAQTWPAKMVHVISPFAAGSTPDVVARLVADGLAAKYPGSVFIVEDKPGASGNIGTDAIAKAAPDGTTIGVSIGGPLAINTLLFAQLPYDPKKDVTPITQLVTQPSALVVNVDLKVNSVSDLIALLKSKPGTFNFASIGNGSLSHLAMEAVALKSGAKIVHVPYPGSPQATLAIMRNDAQMGILPAASVVPQAKAEKLNLLAVSTAKRSPYLPDVPTLGQSGIDVEADAWMGLIGPGNMPKPLVDAINKDVVAIINLASVRDKLAAQLMEPAGSSPQEFRAKIDAEIARWAPVIKAANVKLE